MSLLLGLLLGCSTPAEPVVSAVAPPRRPSGDETLVVEIQGVLEGEGAPIFSQEVLRAEAHVIFSGTLISSRGYDGPLMLRINYPPGVASSDAVGPLTALLLERPGPFELALPAGEEMLLMEVLGDTNGDGQPSMGERAAITPLAGALAPTESRSGLVIEVEL